MKIGKLYIGENQKIINENEFLIVKVDEKTNHISYTPTEKCVFDLYSGSDTNYNGTTSFVKRLSKIDVEYFIKYSLIDLTSPSSGIPELNKTYYMHVSIPYMETVQQNGGSISTEKLFTMLKYKLTIIDTKSTIVDTESYNNGTYITLVVVDAQKIFESSNIILKYEDDNHNILKEYDFMSIFDWENGFTKHTIIPNEVKYIGVYCKFTDVNNNLIEISDENFIKLCSFDVNYSESYDEPVYSVGLVSDIHYNDVDESADVEDITEDGSYYWDDLKNASKVFGNQKCDMICCSGDISTDNPKHIREASKAIKSDIGNPNNIPFYTCTGNHDHCANRDNVTFGQEFSPEQWTDNINWHPSEIHYAPNDNLSYYFLRPLNPCERDIKYDCFIFLSVNYNNNSTTMTNFLEGSNTYDFIAYMPSTLTWLADVLETNKHHRCFIFTHQFFSQKAGNYNGENKNLYSYVSGNRVVSTNSLNKRSYILVGKQFDMLNELNNKYKNTIWFTGHSHYKFEWQKYDSEIIVCNNDYELNFKNGNDTTRWRRANNTPVCRSGYNVHLPSLARPLKLPTQEQIDNNYQQGYNSALDLQASEGAIMKVHYDYVDIYGYNFKLSTDNDYRNKIYPYGVWRINICAG